MAIKSLSGNLEEVAPKIVESVVLWIENGFNPRYVCWGNLIKNIEFKLIEPIGVDLRPNAKTPWLYSYDTIWEIESNPTQKLKYIYVFSNPNDTKAKEGGVEVVKELIYNSMNKLCELGVSSVGMLIIPVSETGLKPSPDGYKLIAQKMIESLISWETQSDKKMGVILIDKKDGFASYI